MRKSRFKLVKIFAISAKMKSDFASCFFTQFNFFIQRLNGKSGIGLLGMSIIKVNPPVTAALDPVRKSSFWVAPGSLK